MPRASEHYMGICEMPLGLNAGSFEFSRVSDERLHAILGQVIAHPTSDERSGHTPDRHTLHLAERAARETLRLR